MSRLGIVSKTRQSVEKGQNQIDGQVPTTTVAEI
jgi:hypothetical protein